MFLNSFRVLEIFLGKIRPTPTFPTPLVGGGWPDAFKRSKKESSIEHLDVEFLRDALLQVAVEVNLVVVGQAVHLVDEHLGVTKTELTNNGTRNHSHRAITE